MFNLNSVIGHWGGGAENMPTPEETRRLQDEVRLQNALASMSQGIDRRFKAMEMRIVELEQLHVPENK